MEVWASNTLSSARLMQVGGGTSLTDQFHHQYFTVKEILDKLQEVVIDINVNGLTDENLAVLNRLAKEGSFWNEDETEVVPA